MLPVLFRFTFQSTPAQILLYLVGVAIIVFTAVSGWRGAVGPVDPKTGKPTKATTGGKATRAIGYGVISAVIVRFGFSYALPKSAPLGGKGLGLPLHTYGLMIALGFIGAVAVAAELARREWHGKEGKKKREQIMDLALWVLLGGIGGAKLLFILVNWQDYFVHFGDLFGSVDKLLSALGGGFVFYGGLLGAMATSFWYARKNDIDFLRLSDLAIPTVSLGQGFGRLGCFSAGCCWGKPASSHVWWAVNFPGAGMAKDLFDKVSHVSSLAFASQSVDPRWVVPATGKVTDLPVAGAVRISDWVLAHGHTLPIHPTQLYESLGEIGLFFLLLYLRRYRRFHGQILAYWLIGYAILRSTVEVFRGDLERGTVHGLFTSLGWQHLAAKVPDEAWFNISTSQSIAIVMVIAGVALLWQHRRKRSASADAPPSPAAA